MTSNIVKFQAPEIQVDPAFWRWVSDYKLTQQRLSTAPVAIAAFETAKTGVLYLPHQKDLTPYQALVPEKYSREYFGTLVNLNTIEDFLAFDRKAFLEALAHTIPGNPYQFAIIAFSDLKTYKFTFNCAIPVFAPPLPLTGASEGQPPLPWSARATLYKQMVLRDPAASVEAVSDHKDVQEAQESGKDTKNKEKWSIQGGWVRFNDSVTKVVDLKEQMDPRLIAQQAVTLNIELMRWRIVPELQYEKFANKKFLLLGAGTLGCAVARGLIAWGVRRVTFVDNGRISFSNPVRQSLFTFEDARQGLAKAPTAARRLGEITPGLEVEGVEMEIPMPSHEHGNSHSEFDRLQNLISEHDVVLLLTDSRESRYFPSVACAATGKLAVSVALGFDSFLVKLQKPQISACYFCNDVAAPNDSTSHRSLDLQCTVTRPGVSSIASNLAVEILASLLTDAVSDRPFSTSPTAAILGAVPDQVRGFLADFRLVPSLTEPAPQCICCSRPVLDAFRADPANFVLRATKDPSFLEDLSELKKAQGNIDLGAVLQFDDDEQFDE